MQNMLLYPLNKLDTRDWFLHAHTRIHRRDLKVLCLKYFQLSEIVKQSLKGRMQCKVTWKLVGGREYLYKRSRAA